MPWSLKCKVASVSPISMVHRCSLKKSLPRITSTPVVSVSATITLTKSSSFSCSCTCVQPCNCIGIPCTPTNLCPTELITGVWQPVLSHSSLDMIVVAVPVSTKMLVGTPLRLPLSVQSVLQLMVTAVSVVCFAHVFPSPKTLPLSVSVSLTC